MRPCLMSDCLTRVATFVPFFGQQFAAVPCLFSERSECAPVDVTLNSFDISLLGYLTVLSFP